MAHSLLCKVNTGFDVSWFDQCLVRCSLNIFLGSAGGRPRPSNKEFVLRVQDCQDLCACMSYMSVQCLVLNFVLANCRKWLHQKYCSTSTHFQYLSAKIIFWGFSPQPITLHETEIQKWLWAELKEICIHIWLSSLSW